jgi:uncharacterized protein YkwD
MAVTALPSVRDNVSHRRRVGRIGAALLVALLLGSVLSSCETTAGDRRAVVGAVNHSRAQAGLPALRENAQLNHKASMWASTMRDQCRIWHSHLADGAPSNWQKLGENVGRGGSIAAVHTAYMNSPGHRANILDRSFNQIGTGAVWGTCNGYRTVFTVHVFMKG